MSADTTPIGWVSYVHDDADNDELLIRFLGEVATELAARTGVDADDALFVDRRSLSAGDVWESPG
jgi:hypothetical protein